MEIKCPACDSGYRIPEEKLPADKEVIAFPCPNCSHPLTLDLKGPAESTSPAKEIPEPVDRPEATDDREDDLTLSYDAMEKPFDFMEEGGRTALICESDPQMKQNIRQKLEALGFNCAEAESTLGALKQMRYHVFDLIVLNERYDGKEPDDNPIRIYLSRIPMSTRRNILVVLVTQRFRTMDNMAAYHLSVNAVIHEKHIDQLEQVVQRSVSEDEAFYRIFKEAQESVSDTETVLDREF